MAKKQLQVAILLIPLGALACSSQAQLLSCPRECGRETDVMECRNNLCCNEEGRCGIGNKYCDTGCQSGACYNSLRCHIQDNGRWSTCPNNYCCAKDGTCGLGEGSCGPKCVSGPCAPPGSCDSKDECPNNLCCSGDGHCGLGIEYCGGECKSGPCSTGDKPCVQAPDGSFSCPNNYYCSGEGFCGLGNAYYGVGCKGGPCIYPAMNDPVTCLL